MIPLQIFNSRSFESGLREATISSHDLHKVYSRTNIPPDLCLNEYPSYQRCQALLMLGLNPSEQEVVDMPNEIARSVVTVILDGCPSPPPHHHHHHNRPIGHSLPSA